jgi:hypothetical protein
MSKELWAAVKPLLEEALELAADSRSAWLQQLRERSPVLADEVSALLDQSAEELDHLFAPAGGNLWDKVWRDRSFAGYARSPHRSAAWYRVVAPAVTALRGQAAVKLLNLALLARPGNDSNEGSVLAPHSSNIARLYDAGVWPVDSIPHSQYVEGVSIDRYADEHRLTVDQRIWLMIDVLTAVGSARQPDRAS